MARGITESDVHGAADALVADGEAIAQHEERLRDLTQSSFVRPYLTSQFEEDWFRSYPKGPHRI